MLLAMALARALAHLAGEEDGCAARPGAVMEGEGTVAGPGDELRELAVAGPGGRLRILRCRHQSDQRRVGGRTDLGRIHSSDDLAGGAGPEHSIALPITRTLSTSLLRIKQRRSFWEKCLK